MLYLGDKLLDHKRKVVILSGGIEKLKRYIVHFCILWIRFFTSLRDTSGSAVGLGLLRASFCITQQTSYRFVAQRQIKRADKTIVVSGVTRLNVSGKAIAAGLLDPLDLRSEKS